MSFLTLIFEILIHIAFNVTDDIPLEVTTGRAEPTAYHRCRATKMKLQSMS